MSEPRLQSIILSDAERRELFRRAREALVQACGDQTIAADSRLLASLQAEGEQAITLAVNHQDLPRNCPCYLLDETQQSYPLHVGINTIGRLMDNDVVLRDECISRRHCAIVVHHDWRCEIYDTASKNGTFVNDQRISGPTPLRPGDRITLCNRTLTFCGVVGSVPTPPTIPTAEPLQ
ncbi:MAG: FHA domain-containing protein [Gemmataceae bacterium]|nr:FHA domain-containing protein [Gemmataceae bacterium]MCS7271993.1 FHA domain-containing protein [Gemmataceae bacterium]MDW8243369.1 FHA domain-containing protein [Thermogemmata sp.]